MNYQVQQNKLRVFLSETSKDAANQRIFLYNVLKILILHYARS